ncbi:MAG TPA: nuclear transport factor 2 family protein [Gemmatimonadales bacterium]
MHAPKRRLALAVVLLVTLGTADVAAQSGDLDAGGRAALLAAREQVWRSWFENDQPQLDRLLPPTVIAINYADTTWYDRAGVIRGAEEFARTGVRLVGLAFPRTEIQSFGDVAILYSLFRVETESQGERAVDSGRATEVFVHRDGRWLNASWHLDSGR